jgi:hypothetical protein
MLGWMVLTAQASTTVDQEQAAPVDGVGVSIELVCGSLTVRGGDVVKVKITGSIDDPEALSVSTSPGHVSIEVDSRWPNRDCAELVVLVPRAAAIDVETVSAVLTVESVTGPVELESTSGPIRVAGDSSGVSVESIAGSVSISGRVKRAEVSTVSGPILLDRVVGPVQAESVSGAIRISGGAPLPGLSAESVSAPITVAAVFDADARVSLESHSGALVFALPQASDATIAASTLSGRITSAFGATRGAELELVLGKGTASVHLETFSGPITVSRLELP